MKNLNILFLIAIATLFFVGCGDDYLDSEPLNKISGAAVFESEGYTEAFLYDIYSFMPSGYGRNTTGHRSRGYGQESHLDCTTGILVNKSGYTEAWTYVNSGQTPTSGLYFGNWTENYRAIYECNTLIKGVDESSISDNPAMQLMKNEARFLRAFMYFDLVRRYGAVPLIIEVSDVSDPEALYIGRSSVDDIYDFIDAEYTAIADNIPMAKDMSEAGSNWGRVCREAVWGFHGKALLYAKRYAESAAMSKKVIDAVEGGTSDREMAQDYEALFLSRGDQPEVLFEILLDGVHKGGSFDEYSRIPTEATGWAGQHNPTEDLVASYEMTNGLPATVENGFDPQDPYTNRDPRLDQSILHHGSQFYGITLDLAWKKFGDQWTPKVNGVSPNAPHNYFLSTITGYYLRKYMDPDAPDGQMGLSSQSWIVLRLGEVYLNYAEAQNEAAGPDQSVYNAVNVVRNRSNMPNLEVNYPSLDKAGMFERIKQERKVELAFEDQYFWDIRRWRIGAEVCNGSVPINPAAPEEGGYMSCCYPLRQDDGSVLYLTPKTKDDVLKEGETLALEPYTNMRKVFIWNDKNYLMPIPQSAIDKNPALTQNPGY